MQVRALGQSILVPVLVACGAGTPVPVATCPPVASASAPVPAAPPPPAAPPRVAAGDFTVDVHALPLANLSYHLDCLADLIHCSKGAFEPLWKEGWTKDDDAALAEWTRVRKAYDLSAPFEVPLLPAPMPLPYDSLEFGKRVRIAALLSADASAYGTNLRVLLPPQDADVMVTAIEHFRPRFDAWWSAQGEARARPFRDGLADLFEKGELGAIVTRVARFYATPLPHGTTIDFDVIVAPGPSKSTSAEQMLGHGVIEVVPDERPEDRMDVVCHELFHFFYNSRSPAQQAALAARFGASPDPVAGIAYFLLDESVATALGNGVVDHAVNPPDYAKRLAREMGFYGNHAIDATAKGLLARTNGDPTKGPPLDAPETTVAIIAAARDAVGEAPRPIEYLHSFAGAGDAGWWKGALEHTTYQAVTNNTYERAPLDSAEGVAMLRDHPSISAVLLASPARLGALAAYGDLVPKAARDAIAREAKRKEPFAYVLRRSPHAFVFILVGDDAKEARTVAEGLFTSDKTVPGVFRLSAASAK